MPKVSPRSALAPLALFGFSISAYFLVLGGVVPVPQKPDVVLLALAGVTTIAAAVIRAKIPAVTAGVVTLGFALGFATDPLVVTVAAALTILGGLGFLVGTANHVRKRATTTNST
ncbi:hypothetical protein [Natrinema sp. 1APR25-10V2]|uniref:hypothetical protein n=1 Tax=Natrinema sp. 1APR25-10V2 TaxID=2951081 RepID=UPI002874D2D3|nr:hypothetical protein [Natrinema sp. 1APR25-10V2]MDS0474059.1 hypothetical protein [Natrinema sp. 1APR25-10V2]